MPTGAFVTPVDETTVHLSDVEAFTSGEINFDQSMSGVMLPASVGSVGRAPAGAVAAVTSAVAANTAATERRMVFLTGRTQVPRCRTARCGVAVEYL